MQSLPTASCNTNATNPTQNPPFLKPHTQIQLQFAKFLSSIDLHQERHRHSSSITSSLPSTLIISRLPKLCKNRLFRSIFSRINTLIASASPQLTISNAGGIACRDWHLNPDLTSIHNRKPSHSPTSTLNLYHLLQRISGVEPRQNLTKTRRKQPKRHQIVLKGARIHRNEVYSKQPCITPSLRVGSARHARECKQLKRDGHGEEGRRVGRVLQE